MNHDHTMQTAIRHLKCRCTQKLDSRALSPEEKKKERMIASLKVVALSILAVGGSSWMVHRARAVYAQQQQQIEAQQAAPSRAAAPAAVAVTYQVNAAP